MEDLAWIVEARKHIGLREIKGAEHEPQLIAMLEKMGGFTNENRAWWRDDETPWCGLFVGYCLGKAGRFVIPHWYRARAWAEHPALTKLNHPAYGCLAVFERRGGGHVGFVVGEDENKNLMVLGGNQGDAVNVRPFSRERVVAYVWAAFWRGRAIPSRPLAERYRLPKITNHGLLLSSREI